jgi:hypothetical protein
MKICSCGSGKSRHELTDATGLFCGFVCEDCEAEAKSKFNPRIFQEAYDPDQPEVHFHGDH